MAEILVSAILEELASINRQHVGEEMKQDLEKLTTNFKAILGVLVKSESGLQVRKENAADKAESGLQVQEENAADKAESGLQVGKEIAADKAQSGLQVGEENAADKAESGLQTGEENAADKAESGLQAGKEIAADKAKSELQLGKEIAADKAESGPQVGEENAADKAESGPQVGEENAADKADSGLQLGKEIAADKAQSGLQVGEENAADKAEGGLQTGEENAADKAESGLQAGKEIAGDKAKSELQLGKEIAADKAESGQQVGEENAADKAESGPQVQEENATDKADSGLQLGKEIAADIAESGLPLGKEIAADKAESGLQVGKENAAEKAESGLQVRKKIDAVRDWLEKLKETSSDIHNMLVECRILIDKASRKVFSLTPCDRICFRQDMLHDCAQKIKQLSEKLDSLEKDKPDFSFTIKLERPPTTSSIDQSKVHLRTQDIESLVNELLKESKKPASMPVISIVGMAGIGKTALAQAVFKDDKVKNHFEKPIWFSVSGRFDNSRMVKEIRESLEPKSVELQVSEKKSKPPLEKKFLIILDDVWALDPSVWKQLKDYLESYSKEGSSRSDSNIGRILVTTRKKDVAENIGSTKMLQPLSQDESWSLFKQLATSGKYSELNEQFETIGRKIVNNCKGLPLAIMTLGSLLQSKTDIKEWQTVADREMWELKAVQEKIFPSLLSSYFDLPFELRKIFSYCALFPKDYEIEKTTLVYLWMTLCYGSTEQTEDVELINDECIEKLATYSFLKNFRKNEFDGSMESFVLYDIMHEFAQFLSKHGWFIEDIDDFEESRVEFSCGKAQHHLVLELRRGELFPMHISGGKTVSSLAVRCDRNMNSMTLSKLFGDFPYLQRLYLSNCLNFEKLPRAIKKLIHLLYLDLSKNERLTELPEALCELHNLKTLDINGCIALKKLPQGMGKLEKLRHLLNSCTYRKLSHLPKGIENLNELQTLKEFVASRDRQGVKGGLKCLEKLNNLQGSLDILKLQNVAKKSVQVQRANLKDMKELLSLRLDFGWEGEESRLQGPVIAEILEISEVLEAPPPNLKTLGIYSYQGKKASFNWTPLTKLKVLTLDNCVNWENLPSLGKLSSLESLHISFMDSVKKVGDEFLGTGTENISGTAFQNLKILTFSQMAKWEDWIVSRRVMPSLESLSISVCKELKSLPDYILKIPTLKKLEINECSLLKALYNEQTESGRSKISHIPNREIK